LYKKQNIKYSTHKLPSIKYTNNNSACKLPQNSNTKAHFCNRLPDNIKHCLTSSIPGSGQQVKSPISSHHMLYKQDHFLLHNKSCIFKTKVPSRLQSDSTTITWHSTGRIAAVQRQHSAY